jgi:hypothetical protein
MKMELKLNETYNNYNLDLKQGVGMNEIIDFTLLFDSPRTGNGEKERDGKISRWEWQLYRGQMHNEGDKEVSFFADGYVENNQPLGEWLKAFKKGDRIVLQKSAKQGNHGLFTVWLDMTSTDGNVQATPTAAPPAQPVQAIGQPPSSNVVVTPKEVVGSLPSLPSTPVSVLQAPQKDILVLMSNNLDYVTHCKKDLISFIEAYEGVAQQQKVERIPHSLEKPAYEEFLGMVQ